MAPKQEIKHQAVERFSSLFDMYSNRLNGLKYTPYYRVKERAIAHLREIGFPDQKNEDWKYTNLTKMLKVPFQHASGSGSRTAFERLLPDAYTICFDNGQLSREASDLEALNEVVEVMTIEKAMNTPGLSDQVMAELEHMEKEGTSAFSLISLAFAQGWVFRIKRDQSLQKPVQIIYRYTQDEEAEMVSQLAIFIVEDGAKADMLEITSGAKATNSYMQSIYNRILIGRNAHFTYLKLQEEGAEGHLIHTTEVMQQPASTFTNLAVDLGGKMVRNNMYVTHLGQEITTNLYGIYLAKGERQHIDNQTFIDHAHPHCQSNELYKGILDNHSKGVFNGKVIVRQDAQKINAFQQNASLLLSDHASVDSKPQLEIFADDVRCSHGATIGQLDEQALYYLRTRGLREKEAQSLLQTAFLQEVFTHLGEHPLAEVLSSRVQHVL